jgi:hypothetical protein
MSSNAKATVACVACEPLAGQRWGQIHARFCSFPTGERYALGWLHRAFDHLTARSFYAEAVASISIRSVKSRRNVP